MRTYLQHIFTSADNETFSMSKLIAFIAAIALCVNFVRLDSTDASGFGLAVAGLIAALAAKTFTDVK